MPKISFASFWARVLLALEAAAVAGVVAGGGGAAGAAVGTPLTAVEGRVSAVDEAATAAAVVAAEAEAGRAACWEGGSQFLVKTHSAGGGQYSLGGAKGAANWGCQSERGRSLLWRSKM